ncbi:MAG: hypothetical protein OXE17_16105 [Chloroflexi bacterium]|nr:hypothetical protein [Chloroflexota bacterium]
MQQPLEDRVTSLEASAQRHDQTIARLDAILEHQDQLLERVLTNQDRLEAKQDRLEAVQETIANLLVEVTRDAANTRRLWLRLAQRYGWLDDEQNGAQQDPQI